jgi:hypothetical protein
MYGICFEEWEVENVLWRWYPNCEAMLSQKPRSVRRKEHCHGPVLGGILGEVLSKLPIS